MALFPTEMENYHEPFVGGGSVLLAVLAAKKAGTLRIHGTVYASDLNRYLIALYKHIQSNIDALLLELKTLVEEFSACTGTEVNRKPVSRAEATSKESYYYWTRSRFNAAEDRVGVQASAMLLFLNKTCFRGVYREGPRGFNVPYGNYKNPAIYDEAHLRAISNLLQGVVFTAAPFQESLAKVATDDFVYLDPPYAPETETSFVSYTADGFSGDQHRALFALCESWHTRIKMVMSNAAVKAVKDAFPTPVYTTQVISCRRAIHSKDPTARTNEVLIRNFE